MSPDQSPDFDRQDYMVLNSVANVSKALYPLGSYERIHCFLDNDRAGMEALQQIRKEYDNTKQMVKEKTGRAMQEKERERKSKNGKIVKIAGCSPIREGVLLVRSDTTLADVRKFGEECQRRWGITPLQIFLHKDEGHWLNSQPEAEDKESFKVGDRWFKPNYHAHIVFDWMNHETGKSRKLNDDDMMQMQTLASDILLMERRQSKTVTGKEHLERNDFIIKKQKAELQRMDAVKRHKEEQINLAEQELKQVKSEIRTDKLKKTATTAATAITSGVASLFGSGKLKELERANEKLHAGVVRADVETGRQLRRRNAALQADPLDGALHHLIGHDLIGVETGLVGAEAQRGLGIIEGNVGAGLIGTFEVVQGSEHSAQHDTEEKDPVFVLPQQPQDLFDSFFDLIHCVVPFRNGQAGQSTSITDSSGTLLIRGHWLESPRPRLTIRAASFCRTYVPPA